MIDAAMEKLQKEIDLKKIIKLMRVSHLVQKIVLSKRQRWSVPHFRRYKVKDELAERDEKNERNESDQPPVEIKFDRIIDELKADQDPKDARILYELSGIRVETLED